MDSCSHCFHMYLIYIHWLQSIMNGKPAVFIVIVSLIFIVIFGSFPNLSAVKMACASISANTFRCVFIYDDLSVSVVDCTTHADKTKTCTHPAERAVSDLPTSIQDALAQIAKQEGETIQNAIPHKGGIDSNTPLAPK
jgi:hypothetical protein